MEVVPVMEAVCHPDAAAVEGMHPPTMERASAHAATVETAAVEAVSSAATAAPATTVTGGCIGRCQENRRRHRQRNNQHFSGHRAPPLFACAAAPAITSRSCELSPHLIAARATGSIWGGRVDVRQTNVN
jgi:hypothetical protein